MPAPIERQSEEAVLDYVLETARRYLAELDESPALPAEGVRFGGALPEEGEGAVAALGELVAGADVATRSSGPRFFHFVTGGTTPAALGADWLTSLLDQNHRRLRPDRTDRGPDRRRERVAPRRRRVRALRAPDAEGGRAGGGRRARRLGDLGRP